MRIAICDDEKIYRDGIYNLCREQLGEYGVCYECFASGEELLSAEKLYDYLFLDIEMTGMDGIRVKEQLESRGGRTKIIFLTSHDERMIEAFGANVIGFLKKPLTMEAFMAIVRKISAAMHKAAVKWEDAGQEYMLYVDDIRYIEAQDKYTYVATLREKYLVRRTLKEWEAMLSDIDFCRVNRSHLVNLDLFDKTKDVIVLEEGKSIRLSRKYKEAVLEQYRRYLRKRMDEL